MDLNDSTAHPLVFELLSDVLLFAGDTAMAVVSRHLADPRPRVDIGPPFRRFNGGWLALDFVNTVPGWIPHPQDRDGWQDLPNGERLLEYADLIEWSRLQDVVSDRVATSLERASRKRPKRAGSVMRRARTMRAMLYRLFRASALGWSPRAEDVELLNAELARLRRREVVAPGESGLEVVWLGEEAELEGLLWPPLRSAVSLLTTPDLADRLGQLDAQRRHRPPGVAELHQRRAPQTGLLASLHAAHRQRRTRDA